jgi:hypothetical protein
MHSRAYIQFIILVVMCATMLFKVLVLAAAIFILHSSTEPALYTVNT